MVCSNILIELHGVVPRRATSVSLHVVDGVVRLFLFLTLIVTEVSEVHVVGWTVVAVMMWTVVAMMMWTVVAVVAVVTVMRTVNAVVVVVVVVTVVMWMAVMMWTVVDVMMWIVMAVVVVVVVVAVLAVLAKEGIYHVRRWTTEVHHVRGMRPTMHEARSQVMVL